MVSQTTVEALSVTSELSTPPPAEQAVSRRFGGAILALPGIAMAVLDWIVRGDQISGWPGRTLGAYAAMLVLCGIVWAGLLAASGAPRAWGARTLLVLTAALAIGPQIYFFGRYHAYMNPRAVLVGTSMMPSVGQQLWSDRAGFLGAVLLPVAAAVLLVTIVRRTRLVDRARARVALDVALAALVFSAFFVEVGPRGGEQAAPPDALYFASIGRLAFAHWRHDDGVETVHPGSRTPLPVPLIAARGDRRSLLFVVTESVRAIDACSVPTSECETTPFTNELLPSRFGFSQMRALDSTTAVSLAVLWSGLAPTASREALHSAPLIWEYAHAAGFDTAYWTSQNLFFANAGTWLEGVPLSRSVSATDLAADPTYEIGADDSKLVDVVLRDLPRMHTPFVGVVHMSNTHFPYLIDERDAPFQPQSRAFGRGDAAKVRNRYRDAVHRQDALVARLVQGLRATPGGDGVVVAFVSDHGEQIRERGALGHTWGVYDEEVRVPFWIDAPERALSSKQAAQLKALQDAPLTQLDVLPTLLDLMGLWNAPEIAPMRREMPGDSLLEKGTAGRVAILTNCSSIFSCAFKNWGAMRGFKKVVGTETDSAWKCFDLARDPDERMNLGAAACGDLAAIAEADGRGTPF
jgi:glucan phosphoethanolaminetransferase (alkaline phosphatase superfamily)